MEPHLLLRLALHLLADGVQVIPTVLPTHPYKLVEVPPTPFREALNTRHVTNTQSIQRELATSCSSLSFSAVSSSERGSAVSIRSCSSLRKASGSSTSGLRGTWDTPPRGRYHRNISLDQRQRYLISNLFPEYINLLVQEFKQSWRVELIILH